jgi:hypothetical protein
MKEFLTLPHDPRRYGHFAVSYIGIDARIQFQYQDDGEDTVGEIYFDDCLSIYVNGELDNQVSLPYSDTIFITEEGVGYDGGFNRYILWLSGSDYQFTVLAKNCSFTKSITENVMIESE